MLHRINKRQRNVNHLWADKSVIKFFRSNFSTKDFKNLRTIYLSLCEIESDFGEGYTISGLIQTISEYSGKSKNIIYPVLKALKVAGLINYKQEQKENGRFGSTCLTLYKWEQPNQRQINRMIAILQEPWLQNRDYGGGLIRNIIIILIILIISIAK